MDPAGIKLVLINIEAVHSFCLHTMIIQLKHRSIIVADRGVDVQVVLSGYIAKLNERRRCSHFAYDISERTVVRNIGTVLSCVCTDFLISACQFICDADIVFCTAVNDEGKAFTYGTSTGVESELICTLRDQNIGSIQVSSVKRVDTVVDCEIIDAVCFTDCC